jgi:glycyl-tRNA synthetase beta chain
MSQDILFELGLEELPSGLVKPLAKELLEQVVAAFDASSIDFEAAQYFATPRRIAFSMKNVSEEQASKSGTRRGPAKAAAHDAQGQPTPALLGFARSCGVPIDALRLEEQEKGAWWVYDFEEKGKKTKEWLPELLQDILNRLSIPKPMRWGAETYQFARPAHWAILMYGQELINAQFFGIHTHKQTFGHRFLHPEAVTITSIDAYEKLLQEAKVIADFSKRTSEITRQIEALAHQNQWYIPIDEDLLEEITSIVEWPQVMVGQFDKAFLEVPEAVLIASMKGHQKCLPVYNEKGHLLPNFIFVSNIQSINPESVINGNEKVMRARLSDAAFFFQQDRKIPLIDYAKMTESVVFEKRLGTLADKTKRVESIVQDLIPHLGLNAQAVLRAVALSKCDLMTGMVSEFPELQGQMGQYYAALDKEPHSIPQALFEQYLPRFSGDALPETDLGYALSLADRLDTLVGIFAIGLKPTGEKDPYKLRRHALAVVRLLIQKPNELRISDLLASASKSYGFLNIEASLLHDLKKFILERMQSYYQSHQYPNELFLAALTVQNEDFYDLSLRLNAFKDFMKYEHSEQLFQSAKRVRQILAQVNDNLDGHIDEHLLQEVSEKQLWHVLKDVEGQVDSFLINKNYPQAFHQLLQLSAPLNVFFEHVFVMSEDLNVRKNRLNLLKHLQKVLYSIVALGS